MGKVPGISILDRTKPQHQKNTTVEEIDCRKHEFRVATVGVSDKGDQITYVFFCIHCLYRTAITDKITIEQPKQGE